MLVSTTTKSQFLSAGIFTQEKVILLSLFSKTCRHNSKSAYDVSGKLFSIVFGNYFSIVIELTTSDSILPFGGDERMVDWIMYEKIQEKKWDA